MDFNLHIKNIGPLTDANLRIGQLTVLAGPNSTGKSFVSKILYSLFNTMNANLPQEYLLHLTQPIRRNLRSLGFAERDLAAHEFRKSENAADSTLNVLDEKILEMESLIAQPALDDPAEIEDALTTLKTMTENMQSDFSEACSSLRTMLERRGKSDRYFRDRSYVERRIASLEKSFSELQKNLDHATASQFITNGLEHVVRENLIRNFQTSDFAKLRGNENHESTVSIADFCKFEISSEDFELNVRYDGLLKFQQYSTVLYLESPVQWKLKEPLERLRLSERDQRLRRGRLTGVPGYFYDLVSELRGEYTGEMDFPQLHEKLTGKNVLGGSLAISEASEILFRENDRSFQLTLTATGVINLGILALLIERKILDKNSFVFIDEPEAHLHPAWQVVMADTLLELAKGGAHVVIATHSIDILKRLEVHAKKNPEDKGLIALNQFPPRDGEGDVREFDEKVADILQELTDPFAETFVKGI
ncbi:MAG: putative AAA ATPase domain-containing protein [Arenicellales bacterium IbO2]|nr:ATP-binding protein [Gammaproteobacteria bacterium]MDA8009187.1 ATP-binding protein [Alphaproteobacteria bacterium]MDA8030327.1 ATP-binding protein [Alphaproteobacteria bacterium]MDA8041314.1 ATP-binding protein [Pirellulales bacterium]CAJ2376792.1 MAG: putative AAA ATPase domain-containing protein [Arenicellales bacterium IbO2]